MIKNIDKDYWDTPCSKCGKIFHGKTGLNIHISRKHKKVVKMTTLKSEIENIVGNVVSYESEWGIDKATDKIMQAVNKKVREWVGEFMKSTPIGKLANGRNAYLDKDEYFVKKLKKRIATAIKEAVGEREKEIVNWCKKRNKVAFKRAGITKRRTVLNELIDYLANHNKATKVEVKFDCGCELLDDGKIKVNDGCQMHKKVKEE